MKKLGYLGYQTISQMIFLKKRYILYIVSFYTGLLLPVFCIANLSFIKDSLSYYVFDGMEESVRIDWFSTAFKTGNLGKTFNYSVTAMHQEIMKEWDHKPVSIKGIDKNNFYKNPDLKGRMFTDIEMDRAKSVCIVDMMTAQNYNIEMGDYLQLNNHRLEVVGLISDSNITNIIMLPFGTMETIYGQQNIRMQFSATIILDEIQNKENTLRDIESSIQEKDIEAKVLFVEEGKEAYKRAVQTMFQWKVLRIAIALGAVLFFVINQMIIIIGKMQMEKQTLAIKMALGADIWEIGICSFFEMIFINFSADILVLSTILPLAKVFSLDKIIILDGYVVLVTFVGSIVICGTITLAVMQSLFRFQAGSTLGAEEVR